ncbi:MarR family winged helix-turn-helix transcriptional regulator [Methylobacter marinus]|uniref:MarR family winged helix-turn-helix transcriptional regulator n=1 Tax=Methylobacter marinus TaxID=34058 RepID=UPI00035C76A0|nr:helix-turn-helix domain-containing protein [Methylobacter marinus]
MQELKNTFKLIERISTLVRSEERKKYAAIGLQPIHIQVLDYLSRCNWCSDTPAAVAEYLGLTKGTVSQTIQVLERKGYLERSNDTEDGRVVHLALSKSGTRLLDELAALDVFAQAENALAIKKYATLGDALNSMLRTLQITNNARTFGVCDTCVNFNEVDSHYQCDLAQVPLSRSDTEKICREHRPADIADD